MSCSIKKLPVLSFIFLSLSLLSAQDLYKVGEAGTCGGWIFYDKGFYSNGWRYLECAPEDSGFVEWGCNGSDVSNTSVNIGKGKKNTELILQASDAKSEMPNTMSSVVKGCKIAGKTDWFVPSRDELNLMFQNLKVKKIGNFTGDWYWSSSQCGGFNAWYQNFEEGYQDDYGYKSFSAKVRLVRQF